MSDQLSIGVIFGGRSVEHEVSVVTAQQVLAALDGGAHRTVPVYVAKSGAWYTGDVLRDLRAFRDVDAVLRAATEVQLVPADGVATLPGVRRGGLFGGSRTAPSFDVAMPLIHGSHGEDGTLQGMLEMAQVAYTGSGVAASAVSMDKPLSKSVLRDAGLPVIEHAMVERGAWAGRRVAALEQLMSQFSLPVFVKPATLGSSIGVARADDSAALEAAIDTALVYDTRCLVEPAQADAVDINCSVLGRGEDVRASVCEQPASSGVLTYADKYLTKGAAKKGTAQAGMKGAQRRVPAPLDDALTKRIQAAAITAFRAIGCEGVARVDFLVDAQRGSFVVNEVNTIPGSLSFYLWEPSGVPFTDLLDRLVDLARQRHEEQAATVYSIDTWLLRGRPD